MSTTTVAPLLLGGRSDAAWIVQPVTRKPRHHLASVCKGPECPHKGKLWPSWLHIVSPIRFEGQLYCDTTCLMPVLCARVQRLQTGFVNAKPRPNRMPLGLVLLQRGAVSPAQLREGLRLQKEAGHGKIGFWLREIGAVDEQSLTAALGQQSGLPVFPLERIASPMLLSTLLPLTLLESACVVPAHSASNGSVLYLAFGGRVDHSTLFAIEQVLGRQTVGCVARESVVNEVLESFRHAGLPDEIRFDSMRDAVEMTGAICNYARELQAGHVAVINTSTYIWARLYSQKLSRDMLFRMLP